LVHSSVGWLNLVRASDVRRSGLLNLREGLCSAAIHLAGQAVGFSRRRDPLMVGARISPI